MAKARAGSEHPEPRRTSEQEQGTARTGSDGIKCRSKLEVALFPSSAFRISGTYHRHNRCLPQAAAQAPASKSVALRRGPLHCFSRLRFPCVSVCSIEEVAVETTSTDTMTDHQPRSYRTMHSWSTIGMLLTHQPTYCYILLLAKYNNS